MGARVLSARGSKMSILDKKNSSVLRFCGLLMTSLIIKGSQGNQKIGSFLLNFSLNVMSKFRVPEMTFRGNSDTAKKKNIAPTVKHNKPYGLDLKSSPGGLKIRSLAPDHAPLGYVVTHECGPSS